MNWHRGKATEGCIREKDWREALEYAAATMSSDWPERCQEIVRRARLALAVAASPSDTSQGVSEADESLDRMARALQTLPYFYSDKQKGWIAEVAIVRAALGEQS